MFKKPKRNFRGNRRNLDDDDNEPSQVESAHIGNKPQSFKPEVKIDRSSKSERKILSFHDEIEEGKSFCRTYFQFEIWYLKFVQQRSVKEQKQFIFRISLKYIAYFLSVLLCGHWSGTANLQRSML